MVRRVPEHERRKILKLIAGGSSYREVIAATGRSRAHIARVVTGMDCWVTQPSWHPSPTRLSLAEREEISRGLEVGRTFATIAAGLERSASTVSREVKANGGRQAYRAYRANREACTRARRPRPTKLASRPLLRAEVEAGLDKWWSPTQIARRLRTRFPDEPMMWVSHETIYQSLYVQGRGELRKELAACLRSGRARRVPQGRKDARGKIADMVMISDRPAEVADRAVPGHWEGDLIVGKNNASAVGTLVERSTRFVMLLHLPTDHGAEQVRLAMTKAIRSLPAFMAKTVTWDQGREMSHHATFTVDTGVEIYFCDPHSPWQRGSNENTNGLLRQYMPKSTDLSVHTAEDLERFALSLNGRPRQTLGWMTPSEKLAELLR